MNVRPLHDRIIVQRIEEGEQKVGGIIIPDTAKEKPQQGKVIAAGNGKTKDDGKRLPLDVKAGDLILFGKYSGQEIKLDGEEYLIMREDEVLAVIDEAEAAKKKRKVRSAPPEDLQENRDNGKANCVRRAVAPGDPARREPVGRRGQGHARPQGPQRRPRQEIRIADHHQGRRDGGEGDRPQGPAREHGRADGPRRSPARRPTPPATAPPPPPCSRRRSTAKARRTSWPAPTRWTSSAASRRRSRRSPPS